MSDVALGLRCSRRHRAIHDSGPRTPPYHYVVIHSTESGLNTAEAVARYFTIPIDDDRPASTHLVLDNASCFRCVPDDVIPWGAPPLNRHGFHIEICGRASWTRIEWLKARASIDKAAQATGRWCFAFDIPVIWRGVPALRNGLHGITSHRNVAQAFGETNHTDPGKHFPYDVFMRRVIFHYREVAGKPD